MSIRTVRTDGIGRSLSVYDPKIASHLYCYRYFKIPCANAVDCARLYLVWECICRTYRSIADSIRIHLP